MLVLKCEWSTQIGHFDSRLLTGRELNRVNTPRPALKMSSFFVEEEALTTKHSRGRDGRNAFISIEKVANRSYIFC